MTHRILVSGATALLLLVQTNAYSQTVNRPSPPAVAGRYAFHQPATSQGSYSFPCLGRKVTISWTQSVAYRDKAWPKEEAEISIILEKDGQRFDISSAASGDIAKFASVEKVEGLCQLTGEGGGDSGFSDVHITGHGLTYPDIADRTACQAASGTWTDLNFLDINFGPDGKIVWSHLSVPRCVPHYVPSPSAG